MTGLGRPTASVERVDLSVQQRASAVPATSEEALFRGYRGSAETDGIGIEHRPCVCGGTVTADPRRPAPGVAAHQFTSRHKAWRLAQDYDE